MASGDRSQLKFATATSTSDGDYGSPLVAAVASRKISVMGLTITAFTTAGIVLLKSSTTTIFQAHLAIGSPLVAGYSELPICETASGVALMPNNATGVDSTVTVSYYEVEP